MKPTESLPRAWSDREIRKVASLLAILRDSEELARSAAENEDLDLSSEFLAVRGDALATLRSLHAPEPAGSIAEPEDEMEATHPGIRRPRVTAET